MVIPAVTPFPSRLSRCGVFVVDHSVVITGRMSAAATPRLCDALAAARRAADRESVPLEVDLTRVSELGAHALSLLRAHSAGGLRLRCERRSKVADVVVTDGLLDDPRVTLQLVG